TAAAEPWARRGHRTAPLGTHEAHRRFRARFRVHHPRVAGPAPTAGELSVLRRTSVRADLSDPAGLARTRHARRIAFCTSREPGQPLDARQRHYCALEAECVQLSCLPCALGAPAPDSP